MKVNKKINKIYTQEWEKKRIKQNKNTRVVTEREKEEKKKLKSLKKKI